MTLAKSRGCHISVGALGMHPREAPPLTDARRLRYVLCVALLDAREPRSVAQLIGVAEAAGCLLPGRPSKVVSDALRWEVRIGRVVRIGRSQYAMGSMPRSTEWWLRARLEDDKARLGAAGAIL